MFLRSFAIFSVLAMSTTSLSAQVDNTAKTRDYPITKGDNARIGIPFDTVTGQIMGNESCLQGFESHTDDSDKGAFNKRLLQVSNTLDLMSTLNIDVSASGKLFGTEVTGKMGFAKDTKISQTSLSYALYATFQGAPEKTAAKESEAIRLAQQPMKILKNKGEAAFRKKCGDSYISMIYKGAEAYAVLSFLSVDQSTRTKISTAMQAKGTGWSADGKVDTEVANQSTSGKLDITYSQIGGNPDRTVKDDGTPVDTEWDELKKAIEGLRGTSDTVTVGYQVISYESLISWPSEHSLTPSPELIELAYYRSAYDTLLNTIAPLIAKPQDAEFTHVLGRNHKLGAGDQSTLSDLQTAILEDKTRLGDLFDQCAKWSVDSVPAPCANTQVLKESMQNDMTDPYTYMARMPLEMVDRNAPAEAFLDGTALSAAIFDQYLVNARNSYCAQEQALEVKHPGCMSIGDLKGKHMGEVAANITKVWSPAPNAPKAYQFISQLRRDKACLTAYNKDAKDKRLSVAACSDEAQKVKQRLAWKDTGQLGIRTGECIAGPAKAGGGVSSHDCNLREGQQLWRFIPIKRDAHSGKPGTNGVLQEAGFGRCLYPEGTSGKKIYVRTKVCDLGADAQKWQFKVVK